MQAISWCHNYSIFKFLLKPKDFGKEEKNLRNLNTWSILGKIKSFFHNSFFFVCFLMEYKIIMKYNKEGRLNDILSFLIEYFVAPWLTLVHYWEDSGTHPMLIAAFFSSFDPKATWGLVTRPRTWWGLNKELSDSSATT